MGDGGVLTRLAKRGQVAENTDEYEGDPMPKTVTLHLDDRIYEEFRQAAEAENRPISNLIETAALDYLRERQFVDDVEMAEILANEKLVARLQTGSAQVRARKGAFR
jgi:predicted transcriptional regulator